jgi:signal transduction histidine kinase
MSDRISCPRCNSPVDPQARHCPHCGVNLALAAALTEHTITSPRKVQTGALISPEVLVPRLGDYLIEKKLVSREDLQRALEFQQNRITQGKSCLIGQALVDLELIDRSELDEAVTEQILQLQKALHEANQQLENRVQERTAELQGALSKLTELNQLKTNFISNVSHELRTPLTHIKGYLDMLLDASFGQLNPQQVSAIGVIQKSETRLEKLIDDLIQFSLAARGELSLQLRSFPLDKLIHETVSQSTPKAKANNIKLDTQLPEKNLFVQADEEKIGWVLMQLIDNALKFTPEGGQVIVNAQLENGLVFIAVEDNGIGIPQERISEIFEPFHQLDGSITRRYPGTGLGLTMVNRILNAHGLPIKVQSTVGKGSRFIFSLPIENNHHD